MGNLETEEPLRERLEPKPEAAFARTGLLERYPQAKIILLANPAISQRQLAEQLQVSQTTANRIKAEWKEQPNARPLPDPPAPKRGPSVLSEAEASEMQDTLPAAYTDYFDYLDQYLMSLQKNANPTEVPKEVWSNVTEEEVEKLSKVLIRAGKHNAGAAMVARGLVAGRDYLVTGAIVLPRAMMTLQIVQAANRAPRKRVIS